MNVVMSEPKKLLRVVVEVAVASVETRFSALANPRLVVVRAPGDTQIGNTMSKVTSITPVAVAI